MEKYVELIKDHYPFLAGTQFLVTNEDDGFWSMNPFYAGKVRSRHFSCDRSYAKIIDRKEFTGKVVDAPQRKRSQEEIDDYMNPLNHP